MARINYKMYPTDYINELMQSGKRDKARYFLEYWHDFQHDSVNSFGFYAKSWGTKDKEKSKGTVYKFIQEFTREIEAHLNYWSLKNISHNSSISKISEREVNDNKKISERQNTEQSTTVNGNIKVQVNDSKTQSEREVNKEFNIYNINNIYAESDDSATQNSSYKKHSYSDSFEIVWNLFDKKSSNKNKSFSIFKRRWLKIDIELIKKAIEKYKEKTNPIYIKDFDGFLNGVIDSYIPKKSWLIDNQDRKYVGYFYDCDNLFITDKGEKVQIDANKVATRIESGKFGFAA